MADVMCVDCGKTCLNDEQCCDNIEEAEIIEGKRPLNWVFPFGKYKGLSIGAVIKFNAQYVAWLRSDGKEFELTQRAWKQYIEAFKQERKRSRNNQELWAHGFGKAAKDNRSFCMGENIRIESDERKKVGAKDE